MDKKKPKVHAVILSGGSGSRFDSNLPKQYVNLAGKTILEHSIDAFEQNPHINSIIIVVSEDFHDLVKEIIGRNCYTKITNILLGGKNRIESSYCAINSLSDDDDIIIFHDAVRPLVSQQTISNSVEALKNHDAIAVVIPCSDGIMQSDDGQYLSSMPIRSSLRKSFGPQGFRLGLVREAHLKAIEDHNTDYTEDCAVVLNFKLAEIYLVDGNTDNIKITYPEDLYFAETLLLMSSTSELTVNMEDLNDKNIVVFGGARGVGESIIKQAKEYGANIYSYSRAKGFDIADPLSVKNALSDVANKAGEIDYIICTTTISKTGKLTDRSIDGIKKEVDVNYFGTIHAIKYGTPFLMETKGAFVFFASNSYAKGRALHASHSSINAAIVNLIQAEAEELINDGIRINVINPGRRELQTQMENTKIKEGIKEEDNYDEPTISNDKIAEETLRVLLSSHTGQVINIT